MSGTVTKLSEQFTKISDILSSKKNAIQSVIPKHLTSERLTTVFMSACRKNPKLLSCSATSLVKALMDAGEIGLEPDGINAHLIPYGTECNYMVDYKGYIRLARLSDEVADMTANVVYSNDKFEHEYGTNKHLSHIKTLSKDRGSRVAAYSYVKYKDGSEDFRVLTEAEVMNAKKSSKSENIWRDHPDQMWAKTAVRQHAKFLPRHKELQDAAILDERLDLKDIDISDITEIKTKNNSEVLKEKIAARKKSKDTKPAKAETKNTKPETKPKVTEPPKEEEPPMVDEGGQAVDPDATVNPGHEEAREAKTVDDGIPGGAFMARFTEFCEVNDVDKASVTAELQSLGYDQGIDQVIADSESNQNIVMEYFEENLTKET
jgi:recombination protein RecT